MMVYAHKKGVGITVKQLAILAREYFFVISIYLFVCLLSLFTYLFVCMKSRPAEKFACATIIATNIFLLYFVTLADFLPAYLEHSLHVSVSLQIYLGIFGALFACISILANIFGALFACIGILANIFGALIACIGILANIFGYIWSTLQVASLQKAPLHRTNLLPLRPPFH